MQPIQTRTLWLPIKRASENPRGRRSQAKPAKVKRLKALAFALGVKRIIATRNLTISVSLQGLYFGEGSLTAEEARGWGLSEKQRQEINRLADENGEFIILFDPRGEDPTRTLAHEIGHHIFERKAGYSREQKTAGKPFMT